MTAAPWPGSAAAATVEGYRSLVEGWDGERAARPSGRAIGAALLFLRLRADVLAPSLHVDGSVILEGDGYHLQFTPAGAMVAVGRLPPPVEAYPGPRITT